MPSYDYRCKQCGTRFSLFYKTYADYDAAERHCPNCNSIELSRLIDRVAVQTPTRDYTRMSSNEMLSVFESGDSRQVGEMFQQVGGSSPELGLQYHEATKKLLSGEKMDKVERDLRANESSSKPTSTNE
jgi:putative FmdB family regulatory protein